ncbi:MAG: hypothetical protein QXS38_01270 [Candidatus Pacearchaeota archaeon]
MVVYESKSVFWQALVFTIIVFAAGLILGYYLESSRATSIEISLIGSEINLLDEQMRARIISESNLSCDLAIESTFTFADKIYGEALKLERYGAASKFTKEIMLTLHRRYDLLRVMLWSESIELKKRCGKLHTIVYFFDYDSKNIEIEGRQQFFSRLLLDAKNRNPDKILLIPIAANLDLAAVELARENYNIKKIPSVLIDEAIVVDDFVTLEEMENFIFHSNKTLIKK